ncbi:MAG: transposase [Coriobacteriaceae bacterium]
MGNPRIISTLRHIYWHEHTFWSDGYLIATTGEVSAETLKHYIEKQGKRDWTAFHPAN